MYLIRRYFGSNRPDFIIQPKKNDMTHYFFKLKLIGLGSFSVKNIYMNIFVMPLYCTPPLRVYIESSVVQWLHLVGLRWSL